MPHDRLARRTFLATTAALALATVAAPTLAHWSPPAGRHAHVEIVDRTTGAAMTVHEKDGRHYIVGAPGREYAIRIRSTTGRRILAVTSVDGVNVITGDTASPDQSGYVLDPWGTVEIAGWRKSLAETAAFYFTEHSQSYAARTGRPFDVGVIGVAVFPEKVQRYSQRFAEPLARAQRDSAAAEAAPPAVPAPSVGQADARREQAFRDDQAGPREKLGTGHGRQEASYARQVAFERATSSPAELIAIHYDRRENLVAMGVIPAYPRYADRTPRPFPGLRFVPDPR